MKRKGDSPSVITPAIGRAANKRFAAVVAIALVIHAALGISAGCQLTTTHDEYWHLPIGLLNLKTGRFHFDNLNPPLCRMLAALPLMLTSAQTGPTDASRDPTGWGDEFVALNRARYQTDFALGRSMIVLLSVLGGFATACWARELFGDRAGCLAALLWAFEPNLIAHGSFVTTDMGATAFFVFTLFAAWRFAARPRWTTALLFGLLLGMAQLAKFTSLILYPLGMAVFFIAWKYQRIADSESLNSGGRGSRRAEVSRTADPALQPKTGSAGGSPSRLFLTGKLVGLWCLAVLLSLFVLNAGYLFRGSFSSLKSFDFHGATLRRLAGSLQTFANVPVPLPRDYVEGIDHQRQVMEQKHPVFLDGQWSEVGFPHYYLWAMLYKLPHPLLLLVVAALLFVVIPAGVARRPWLQGLVLLPALAMLGVAEGSAMQLGIRYVLPAIPFLILFASQSAQWFDVKKFPFRSLAIALLTAWMLLSVRYHPGHVAYFNELAGGPLGGREHLLDSNLDWGQDLDGLKDYLERNKIPEIGLVYFGTVPPASLGINYQIPPSRNPQPGRYAVSVNFEQGRPHWTRTPDGKLRLVDIGEFAYFSAFEPVAHIGYSIDVFDLSPRDIEEWQSRMRQAGVR